MEADGFLGTKGEGKRARKDSKVWKGKDRAMGMEEKRPSYLKAGGGKETRAKMYEYDRQGMCFLHRAHTHTRVYVFIFLPEGDM